MAENARNDSHASICITIKATANGTVRNSLLWEMARSCCFFRTHLICSDLQLLEGVQLHQVWLDHHKVMKGTNLLNNNTNCEPIKSKAVWGLVVRFLYPCAAGSIKVSWENLTRGLVANFHTLLNCVTRYIHHADILILLSSKIDKNIKDSKLNTPSAGCSGATIRLLPKSR